MSMLYTCLYNIENTKFLNIILIENITDKRYLVKL